jgi:hypothetical protein
MADKIIKARNKIMTSSRTVVASQKEIYKFKFLDEKFVFSQDKKGEFIEILSEMFIKLCIKGVSYYNKTRPCLNNLIEIRTTDKQDRSLVYSVNEYNQGSKQLHLVNCRTGDSMKIKLCNIQELYILEKTFTS